MPVYIHENHPTFHLRNDEISYVMRVLPDGQLGQLYFGSRIHDRDNYDYLLEGTLRSHSAYPADDQQMLSREQIDAHIVRCIFTNTACAATECAAVEDFRFYMV